MKILTMTVAVAALCAMPAMAEALKTAYWTGGGDRANVNDPANWVVTNSLGVVVENGIPDVETAVVISGETDFNCPFGQTLDYESLIIGDCTLTADCDWRGLVLRPSPAYIDAPKDAYIDTGFKPNQNTRVVMDVTVLSGREYWFGCWNSAYNRGAFAVGNCYLKCFKRENSTMEMGVEYKKSTISSFRLIKENFFLLLRSSAIGAFIAYFCVSLCSICFSFRLQPAILSFHLFGILKAAVGHDCGGSVAVCFPRPVDCSNSLGVELPYDIICVIL